MNCRFCGHQLSAIAGVCTNLKCPQFKTVEVRDEAPPASETKGLPGEKDPPVQDPSEQRS